MSKRRNGCGCGCFSTIIFIIVILVVVAVSVDYFSDDFSLKDISQTKEIQNKGKQKYDKVYSQLNRKQKDIYNTLLDEVPEEKLKFKFTDVDVETFNFAYTAFRYDHPENFWLTSNYNYTVYENGLTVELGVYNYWAYTTNHDKYIKALNEKIDKIVAAGKKYTNVYDKVKYVHDYLVRNVSYDYKAKEEANKTIRSTSTEHALSVYGALVNGKTLCGGYSESFYLLVNALGVDCSYVQGYAGGYHAWNYLKIDGEYYYMDVTWDDYNYKEYPDGVIYNYFCITSEEMARTHTPDEGIKVPKTTATKYNYYKHEGFYFDEYNFKDVAKAYNKQKGQQVVSVKFGSKQELKKAVKSMVDNGRIYEIQYIREKGYDMCFADEDYYTLTFYINH